MPPSSATPTQRSRLPWSVAVTVGAYQLLFRLYPRRFRSAYGLDVLQVFRQCCRDAYRVRGTPGVMFLWFPALLDLCTGAAADYWDLAEDAWRRTMTLDRERSSAITVFCAYIAFVVAGMGFQKMSEYEDFADAAKTHPLIGGSFDVILAGSAVALLAVLLGGIPLAFASLRYALAARRVDIFLLFGVPVLAFAALVGYGALALALARGRQQHIWFIGLVAVLILGAIASAAAISLAVKRSTIGHSLISFARIPAAVATAAMLVMCLATQ